MAITLIFLTALYFVFALVNLRWAVLVLPLFFPAYLLNFQIAGVPFTLIEGFIDATFLAWVVRGIWDFVLVKKNATHGVSIGKKKSFDFKRLSWKLWVPIILILIGAVIGTLISEKEIFMVDGLTIFYGQKTALGILKGWIVTPILMSILFAYVLKVKEEYRLLLDFYTGSSVFVSLWAIWQVISGQYLTPDLRASGPFLSANYLALYIAPALLYAGIRWREFLREDHEFIVWKWFKALRAKLGFAHDTSVFARMFFMLAFFSIGFALFFTKSYAAMVALLLAAFVYFGFDSSWWKVWREKKNAKVFWGVLLGTLIVLGVLAFAVFQADPQKWNKFFEFGERSSSGVRVEIYAIATHLIAEHPLTGIGLGQFPLFYQLQGPRILGHAPYEWNMLHPHNIFFAFWLNLGILGVFALIWILALVFKKVVHSLRSLSSQKSWSVDKLRVVGFALLLVILIHGFFDTPFFKNDLALLFWLIISVILWPYL